jgi:alpha-aminoadipic semialdehyde synthase
MINALRGLGERFLAQGFSTPFLNIGSAYMYGTYEDARSAILKLGEAIRTRGLPEELAPLVFVFTSNGKASKGAQEVFELLPHQVMAQYVT